MRKQHATVTPAMIACIAEMQTSDAITGHIDMLEEVSDYVLSENPPGEEYEDLQKRMHMLQELRMLIKDLKTFLINSDNE